MLADDESRAIMVELLAYWTLGPRHIRLARNNDAYHDALRTLQRKRVITGVSPFISPISQRPMQQLDLNPIGRNLRFHGGINAVRTQFVIQQYRLDRNDARVAVEAGDIVIDGGACYGETALHFADDVGPTGKVLSFEFIPPNLRVLEENFTLNPAHRERSELIRHPLWDAVGETMQFVIAGPGSRPAKQGDARPSVAVTTETIDHVVAQRNLDRVDFIKLDIEGAELHALKGAEQTIRRHRPKLAVCLYHILDDFAHIPAWLQSLDVGYRFYIDHFTIHREETILFADPGRPDRTPV